MGMYLPDEKQVEFIQANLTEVTPELAAALSHPNAGVRQCTAYVIREIGADATRLAPALVARLEDEPERLVRIYLVDALAAIKCGKDEVLSLLKSQFDALDSENVPPRQDGGYAAVDEKIVIAAALFVLTEGNQRKRYLDFVVQWLQPPNANMNDIAISGYWERRWIAVNSLGRMPDATEAIPLLQSMLYEDKAKPWISVHVPRVLKMLRKSGS